MTPPKLITIPRERAPDSPLLEQLSHVVTAADARPAGRDLAAQAAFAAWAARRRRRADAAIGVAQSPSLRLAAPEGPER